MYRSDCWSYLKYYYVMMMRPNKRSNLKNPTIYGRGFNISILTNTYKIYFGQNCMGKPIRIKWLRGLRRHKKNMKKLFRCVYAVQALVNVYLLMCSACRFLVEIMFLVKTSFSVFFHRKRKKERKLIGKCKK